MAVTASEPATKIYAWAASRDRSSAPETKRRPQFHLENVMKILLKSAFIATVISLAMAAPAMSSPHDCINLATCCQQGR